ncbi:MAG: hypothetical protein D6692_11265 [Planctomycetota bacterium]|nr:MAG: hypothetical protein D6692_11265 [Planctomycetota bacterium]
MDRIAGRHRRLKVRHGADPEAADHLDQVRQAFRILGQALSGSNQDHDLQPIGPLEHPSHSVGNKLHHLVGVLGGDLERSGVATEQRRGFHYLGHPDHGLFAGLVLRITERQRLGLTEQQAGAPHAVAVLTEPHKRVPGRSREQIGRHRHGMKTRLLLGVLRQVRHGQCPGTTLLERVPDRVDIQ